MFEHRDAPPWTCSVVHYPESSTVTRERWQRAQEWELAFWSRAEKRRGWRRLAYPLLKPILAPFGHHRIVGDDSNLWWRSQFDDYSFLPANLGAYIELGCGPYTNTRLILRGRTASRVVCSDPLAAEYVRLRDRWLSRAYREGVVEVDSNPLEEIPFPPASFDTVVLINVLDHVREVPRCMENALKLLRKEGWLVLGQDLAKPETVGMPDYRWFEEGHPHRVVLADLEPYLSRLEVRYERTCPPRDARLQTSVLAWAGVTRLDVG